MKWGLTCATVLAALSVDAIALEDAGNGVAGTGRGNQALGADDIVADGREPGSLLIYAEFDNRMGNVSVLTLTNVASSGADARVEFVYIDKDDCSEFNRQEILTPNDTITLLTDVHNPQDEQGYVYAFARSGSTPIVWNNLIGNTLIIDGFLTYEYSTNAVTFLGIGSATGEVQADGTPTDLDGDGNRDLDGQEYAQAPDELLVPRFLGQSDETDSDELYITSELILINLSGGSAFSTVVDFLIYNDNEEIFSSEYGFDCWEKPYLLDISGLFSNEYLKSSTNNDPMEVLGAQGLESGWFRVDGAVANSSVESIEDPAVYCVLVERISDYGVADLPFSTGAQDNGSLLPHGVLGDGDPTPENGDDQ